MPGLLLASGGTLPPEIAAKAILNTRERRPAFTVEVRLSKAFAIEGYHIGLRRVRVGEMLGSGEELGVDGPRRWLAELAGRLRAQRLTSGAFLLPEQSAGLQVREGQISLQRVQWVPSAGLLVEELSVLAESLVGQWCVREGIPACYLVESLPAPGSDPGGHWTPARHYAVQRGLSHDQLQLFPEVNHRRRAGPCVPMSRPLERYSDLMMQQQLVHWQSRGMPCFSPADLERVLAEGAWPREVAERVTQGARRY